MSAPLSIFTGAVASIIATLVMQLISDDWLLAILTLAVCGTLGAGVATVAQLRSSTSVTGRRKTFRLVTMTAILLLCTTAIGTYTLGPKRESSDNPKSRFQLSIEAAEKRLPNEGTEKDGFSELKVAGTVSGLGSSETIWLATLPKAVAASQNVTEASLEDADVWPVFGPCGVTGRSWTCDRVFLPPNEEHYILAYRVDSSAARFFVDYQIRAYSIPLERCNGNESKCKAEPEFSSRKLPRGARLAAHVQKTL